MHSVIILENRLEGKISRQTSDEVFMLLDILCYHGCEEFRFSETLINLTERVARPIFIYLLIYLSQFGTP